MKVMMAGGGTGGHIFIGIALAEELRRREPETELLFVGTRRGMEAELVPPAGIPLEFIESGGLKGMGWRSFLRNLALAPRSVVQSRRIVRRFAPDAAVGLGGYSSGPAILAAWLCGCPTMVVEPNAQPGLANRLLSFIVDRAALALPEARSSFGDKGIVTGIPVREEFRRIPPRERPPREFTLLVYGGSQGSRALNEAMCRALPLLTSLAPPPRVIHQTGPKECETVRAAYRAAGVEADVRPFLPRIYEEFGRADLILSRAGAGTVAELTVAGKASLLVPFPLAADDHQTKNARALEAAGAARLIPEPELRPERLAEEVRGLMEAPERIARMEEAARALARPDAARRIADLVADLVTR